MLGTADGGSTWANNAVAVAWINKTTSSQCRCLQTRPKTILELVIPSEVEGSRDSGFGSFQRIARLRCAPLRMTATFNDIVDKSMLLQELMHLFGQLSSDTFGGGDFVYRCLTQAIHRAEPSQQQILAVLTHTGAIVKNAFAYSFFHE